MQEIRAKKSMIFHGKSYIKNRGDRIRPFVGDVFVPPFFRKGTAVFLIKRFITSQRKDKLERFFKLRFRTSESRGYKR